MHLSCRSALGHASVPAAATARARADATSRSMTDPRTWGVRVEMLVCLSFQARHLRRARGPGTWGRC
jgi:hypothetical protein